MEQSFKLTIVCEDGQLTSDELRQQLAEHADSSQIQALRETVRAAPDATLASVIVVATAAVLRDVIKGLVQIALARERRKIFIQKSNGTHEIQVISEGTDVREIVEKLSSALDSATLIRF